MQDARDRVRRLIFGCPINPNCNYSNCPFLKVWKSDEAKREEFIDSLSDHEILELDYFNDKRCFQKGSNLKISKELEDKIDSILLCEC